MEVRELPPDTNPYAPSAVVDPREELAEAGIGAWRDGDLLVLHRDAQLPAICLKTGQPAARRLPFKVTWGRQFYSLSVETARLAVPLCERRYWMATRLKWVLLVLGIAGLATLLAAASQFASMPQQLVKFIVFGGASVTITLIMSSVALGEPIQLRRWRGDYLWLSGAGSRFLDQLPPWPLGG